MKNEVRGLHQRLGTCILYSRTDYYSNLMSLSVFQKIAFLSFAAVVFFCACTYCCAQTVSRKDDSRYEEIDLQEGRERLEQFRAQRLDGDYCFHFQLVHYPAESIKRIRYSGKMWGIWNEQGPLTRVELYPNAENQDEVIELILQAGVEPKVWKRSSGTSQFELVEGDALYEPVFPGVVYSPFDLQMPYLYWEQFDYVGTSREQARILQQFVMHPPVGSDVASRFGGVRIGLDDTYNALFKVEVLDNDLNQLSEFLVRGLVKLQEQHIVKEVSLIDSELGERTHFLLRAACVGLSLPDEWFDPSSDEAEPSIPDAMFKMLR